MYTRSLSDAGRTHTATDMLGTTEGRFVPHPVFTLAGSTVLLATDGSAATAGAMRVAAALAETHGANVHVVSVVDTSSAPIPPPLDVALAMADDVVGPEIHEEQVKALQRSVAETTGKTCDWPVRVMLGVPASAILEEITRLDASLVVLGLRRHGVLERAVHDEAVLRVMRAARCPVLAVDANAMRAPRRIIAAMDFGTASLRAAQVACAVAPPGSTLVLAYVRPSLPFPPGDGEAVIHELGVHEAFLRAARELARPGLMIDVVALHHEAARTVSSVLLDFAEATEGDLICTGSMQHSRLDRWMLGSVSTDLVRDGRRSVLVVPPLPRAE
jgi:nucleotide-binding universal stress UspA family protein